jgi:hypothetical protein
MLERLVRRPTWWLPFVLWLVVGSLTFVVVSTRIDWEASAQEVMEKQAARSGRTPPAGAAEQAAKMMRMGSLITTPVMLTFMFFAVALVLWGAARIFAGEVRYPGMLAVWGHANLCNVLSSLLAIVVVFQLPAASVPLSAAERLVKSNAAALLPEDASAALVSFAGALDLFSLATLALLVIGFRRIPGLSRGTATAIPIVLWVVYVCAKTAMATLRG